MFGKIEPEIHESTNSKVPASKGSREQATVGASIAIKGDLVGEEDLVVHGRVEGTITLKQNSLMIGKDGHIKADVRARVIVVEGRVEGGLFGDEQVIIKKTGVVQGNIEAPRVSLEDGCKFKGSIEMNVSSKAKAAESSVVASPAAAKSNDHKVEAVALRK
ncbi:polymer-forming cytoskeletal protein [Beggiatoa alba]|nr:polymer-forming cytoskeletal protein [bacterium AH-315-E07]MBN4081880.1 polymer-forming cytoskeletal protein [Beggiatoa alba]